jgi:signal transduction histidine kinase/ActR/RegA family two-component response regulator
MAGASYGATGVGASGETWRRGLASAVALVAAVLLIALVALVAISNRERDAAAVRERHSYDVMLVTRQLDAAMARAEASLGRFVISADQPAGGIYYDEWRRAGQLLRRLRELTRDDPRQSPLVGELRALYDQRGRELAAPAMRTTFRQNMNALSLYYDAGKSQSIARIDTILTRIGDNERDTLIARSHIAERSALRSNRLAALLSGVGGLLVLGAIALGWTTITAIAERRLALDDADAESWRASALEQAVAERTHELSEANRRLLAEAETRAAAEAQLRQVQKMEAVGQLTGGIAHDFNNMLAVVVGGLDLARRRLTKETHEVERHIDNAMEGANRAAQLTKRLLAFARAEPLLPEGVDPGRLVAGMSDLFDRTLGERITIETRIAADHWQVWCDPTMLENALLNLAVNARDAMDGEGRLLIEARNITLGDGEVGEALAGDYVRIAVTDTGCGMPPHVIEHAFEPFFTTKPVGKGTGLGLSQIFGFARQSNGEVEIRSAPGEGATVSIYLPRFAAAGTAAIASQPAPDPAFPATPARGANILLVEDDVRVRSSTASALIELGHHPIACGGGEEALAVLAERADIALIVTDVVMPGLTGPELIARALPLRGDMAVLYVTGYVGEAGGAELFAGNEVLRKPFTIAALDRAVARALGRTAKPEDQAA